MRPGWTRWIALVIAGLLLAPAALAQPAPSREAPSAAVPEHGGVVFAERKSLTATVEAIDRNDRTVTLRGPQGGTVTLKVPPEARNFDQVQVGDTVRAAYLESVALVLRKPGEQPQASETSRVAVAPKGEKPAGAMVDTVEMRATIDAIDHAGHTVTLRGPAGNTRTLQVDPSVKLDGVEVGDDVVVRHTQAVAITVQK